MRPVKFPQQNCTFAEHQPQYEPLPAYRTIASLTSCWRMTWRERLRTLVTGRVYVTALTFNRPPQPLFLATTLTLAETDNADDQ